MTVLETVLSRALCDATTGLGRARLASGAADELAKALIADGRLNIGLRIDGASKPASPAAASRAAVVDSFA